MDCEDSGNSLQQELLHLAAVLNDLRDSLMEAGLVFKDYYFENALEERTIALDQSTKIVDKVKSI